MQRILLGVIVVMTLASFWAVIFTGRTKHLSISLHVAKSERTQLAFGAILGLATVVTAFIFFTWLLPKYGAGTVSYFMFILVTTCLGVVAAVPHVIDTWREPVHNIAAWGLVYVIIVTMIVMLFWPLPEIAWWTGLGLTAANSIFLLLAFTMKHLRQWFLYFQMAYLGVFLSFLLVSAYA